jgi:hypothetical protein
MVTVRMIICENGDELYFEWLEMLFCKTAPYRMKGFTFLELNEMCK